MLKKTQPTLTENSREERGSQAIGGFERQEAELAGVLWPVQVREEKTAGLVGPSKVAAGLAVSWYVAVGLLVSKIGHEMGPKKSWNWALELGR